MPPKFKFQKQEIVYTALNAVRQKGLSALTAREIAAALGTSTRPIFTWYDSMEQLKADVYAAAEARYCAFLREGLSAPLPFLGIWRQYLRFASEEKELYRLLFLSGGIAGHAGAVETLRFSQDLARPSIMEFYRLDAHAADCYFRDIWLVAFSYAALIVTDSCPFSLDEMLAVGAEISLAVCKAYKEIPGLSEGNCDFDAVFSKLIGREKPKGAGS